MLKRWGRKYLFLPRNNLPSLSAENQKCTKTLGGPHWGAYSTPPYFLADGEGAYRPQEPHPRFSPSDFELRSFGPRLVPRNVDFVPKPLFRRHVCTPALCITSTLRGSGSNARPWKPIYRYIGFHGSADLLSLSCPSRALVGSSSVSRPTQAARCLAASYPLFFSHSPIIVSNSVSSRMQAIRR